MKTPIAPAHIALVAGATAALALSATTAAAKPPAQQNQCFWTRMINGFAAPDDHTLNVRVGVRDVYQFQMLGPCPDIDWNQRLALVSHSGGSICNGMDADVITHSPGIGRQRCAVRNMHKLTPEEVAALPKNGKP